MNTQVDDRTDSARPLAGVGIGLMILGALAILAPLAAGIAIAISVGAILIVAGAAEAYLGLGARRRITKALLIVLGLLGVAAGILMLFDPVTALLSLTIVLTGYFLAHGILQLITLFRAERPPGWGWSLANAIASIFLAVVLWVQWPVSGVWAVGLLAGVKLLFSGASMIGIGQTRKHMAANAGTAGPAA